MKTISIEELKKIQLEILDVVVQFCKSNKLTYFLTGGTMLGAARHKGYIPWDDDIDILMPRKDYNIFLKSFKDGYKRHIKVLSSKIDKNYPYAFAKVVNMDTVLIEQSDIEYKLGAYIDVFPLDNLTDNLEDALKLNKKIAVYRKLLDVKKIKNNSRRKIYKGVLLTALKMCTKFVNYRNIVNKIERLSQTYIDNENSKYVAVMVLLTYGEKEIVERRLFFDKKELEFENKRYNVPCGYDEYLNRMYGDYMKLPPKEKQVSHHSFKAWWRG